MGSVLTLNGAIKDGMAGDIVTNVQKNMNGWVESGSGTVTITYADGNNKIAFSSNNTKKYDLTLQTEANKKYLFVFSAKTPTGFTAASNNLSITNGTSKLYVTLGNTASNNYTEYKCLFTAETTSITIEVDLSTVQSSSAVELDIMGVSLYALGVAGGGGGGTEPVTEDFSFQCVSKYPETSEGAIATHTVHVDNGEGYTYLSFDWSNNGSSTGNGWIKGTYIFNGAENQLYWQTNSETDVGDNIKIDISGMTSTFDIVFKVEALIQYQYAISTARLNIANMVLSNE